jgi:hypothetical protein
MNAVEGDGGGRRRPGSFGPFQALSALTDVQRRGMDAAAQVIEGFIAGLDGERPSRPTGPDVELANGQEPGFGQLRISVARALDLYTDLVRRSFEGYADLVEQTLRARGVRLHGVGDGQAELTLQGTAGDQATGTVWLHNTTDQPASAVLHLSGLTAHDGLVVPATSGSFQPAAIHLAPGASVSTGLVVALQGVAARVYRGHVLAGGLPDAALPLRLVVGEVAPGPPR